MNTIELGDLTFFWRTADSPKRHPDIPLKLPLELTFDNKIGLIKQVVFKETLDALEKVYQLDHNIGYLQEGHFLASSYSLPFIDFILGNLNKNHSTVLDIGCGACLLLKEFNRRGFKVEGIDPSPVAKMAADKYGFLVHPYFYNKQFDKQYDIVVHHNFLEHVSDVHYVTNANFSNLTDGGKLFVAVPDCEDQIRNADLSMIWHEHFSYFDKQSLKQLLLQSGFKDVEVVKSPVGGVLFARGTKNSEEVKPIGILETSTKFLNFQKNYKKNLQKLSEFLTNEIKSNKSKIGLYIPLRLLPYLNLMPHIDLSDLRFFDDDRGSHGKYYDGFPVSIENFDDLLVDPPETVFVASYSYGDLIEEKIKNNIRTVKVVKISDLL